ncbi:hypothetical protein TNCV_3926021 [Trichonephila clavipes]|nr:hypothetical protein TNCV_3926021 [Trichonephila clavipes]
MPKNSKLPSDIQKKGEGLTKELHQWGGLNNNQGSTLDARLLWGSQEKKKFGGVTGIGLHAVSMPSLDSRLHAVSLGGSHKKKIGGVTRNGLYAVSPITQAQKIN